MTNLSVAVEVEHLRDAVRDLARTRIAPQAQRAEYDSAVPQDVLRGLDELGVLSPLDPESAGLLEDTAMLLVAEELGEDAGIGYEVIQGAYAALFVTKFGAGRLREELLRRREAGELPLGSLWLYEGYGRGPDEYETTFTRVEGGYRLTGSKIAVVRPGTAQFAVLFGRSSTGSSYAALLGPEQLAQCTVTRDDRAGKLGLNAAHTGNVSFLDLEVAGENVLGLDDPVAIDRLVAAARLATAAVAVGTGMAALHYAGAYAQTREAFGQPISAYQGLTFPLAEAYMKLAQARQAITDLALRLNLSAGGAALAQETGYAVADASSAAQFAAVHGLNTLGGHGFLTDHPAERWYRAVGTLGALDHDPLILAT